MVYFDSVPNIKVGVLLDRPCPLTGRVVSSASPAGTAAMTVHRGSLADLRAADEAVLGWCAEQGLRPGRTRREIYGPNNDDPAQQWTEVYWLLAGRPRRSAGGPVGSGKVLGAPDGIAVARSAEPHLVTPDGAGGSSR
jgi:GyrI-like small molecule binding domain